MDFELLLTHADDRRPMLQDALPLDAASHQPRPLQPPKPPQVKKRSSAEDELVRPDRDPNSLPDQRWGVVVPEGPLGDRLLALIEPLRSSYGSLTLRDVIARAVNGDRGCAQVVEDAGAAIGAVVAGLGVAVNPQCVVVGGELAETGELLLGPLRDAVLRRVLPNQIAPLEVVPAAFGQKAEVLGALALALQHADVPLPVEDATLPPDPPTGGV